MLPAFHREAIARSARDHGPGGRPRRSSAGARASRSMSTRGREAGDADRHARAARARSRRRPQGRARRPSASSARSPSTGLIPAALLRGPGTPWRKLHARERCSTRSSTRRSPGGAARTGSGRGDVLSMLLEATDDDGARLSDREIRDQAMTLMFAGHDTSTSTITFMLHELAGTRMRSRHWSPSRTACSPGGRRPPPSSTGRCPSSTWRWTRRCACTRRRGSARAAPSRSSSSRAAAFPRART